MRFGVGVWMTCKIYLGSFTRLTKLNLIAWEFELLPKVRLALGRCVWRCGGAFGVGGHVSELTSGLTYVSRLISGLEAAIPYVISAQVLISAALALVGPE